MSRVPQQGVADLDRAPQFVAVAARDGLDERGMQGGEAIQAADGAVALDGADVLAGFRVESAGQVLGECRSEQHRRQRDVEGNAEAHGHQSGGQADESDDDNGKPQRSRHGRQGNVPGGAPGQPAHSQALGEGGGRSEDLNLMGDIGRAAVTRDSPGERAPGRVFVDKHRLAGVRAAVVANVSAPQCPGAFRGPPPRVAREGALVVRGHGQR